MKRRFGENRTEQDHSERSGEIRSDQCFGDG